MAKQIKDLTKACNERDELLAKEREIAKKTQADQEQQIIELKSHQGKIEQELAEERKRADETESQMKEQALQHDTEVQQLKAKIQDTENDKASQKA